MRKRNHISAQFVNTSAHKKDLYKKKHIESIHEGMKPHKCSICNYAASRRGNLKRHINSTHEKKYPKSAQSKCNFNKKSKN